MDYVHETQAGKQADKQAEAWKYAITSFLGPVEFKSIIIMKIHKKYKPCANPAQTLRKQFEPHKHVMHVISP